MSDLFHKRVPLEFISRMFDVMGQASWHQFQILTKRAERLEELSLRLPWHENIWMGPRVASSDPFDAERCELLARLLRDPR